ncbi:MAG: Aminopeptidase C [Chlamydiia bacterium]|nr:Aminopeptidase C [Chlamydiia bacterium]
MWIKFNDEIKKSFIDNSKMDKLKSYMGNKGYTMSKGKIADKELSKLRTSLSKDPSFCLARNAVARGNLQDVAMNWDRFSVVDHTYSERVQPELKATSQHRSGRCWLFAAMNLMRIPFAKKYKLEKFEFSQSYLFFYDKLEKSNYFLENIIKTADEPHDGRLVSFLVTDPLSDGGQWDMLVNIIKKYGVVPKSVFPDSQASLNSTNVNYILTLKLREWAHDLRKLIHKKTSPQKVQDAKNQMMAEAYRIMITHFGAPPTKFDWEFTDKNKKFHAHRNLSPKNFFDKFVSFPLDDMICLVDSPRKSTPYNETYTVKYLGNVVEGQEVRYLNVKIDVMKKAAIASIKDNTPVWFGCDVGKCFHRDMGIMDTDFYDYEQIYNTKFGMNKETRMNFGESQMTHAMLFTGVNLVNGKPNKWRVENSWGDKTADKGYCLMTDKWFDEYMFEIAIHKKYLTKALCDQYRAEPQELEPWDPLGALAY